MADILGPATSTPGAVIVMPNDERVFGSDDSYFQDCISSSTDDGTEYRASFFNGLLRQLRTLWRINGGTEADPTVKVVPDVGSDAGGIVKAIQHLIQRGQTLFGTDAGGANALVATLNPVPAEYKAGMTVRIKIAVPNTGAATLNLNGLGAKSIVRPDGSATRPGDLIAGEVAELVYDGARFQKVGLPNTVLSAPRTYYVDSVNGSDANDGLAAGAGHAFATIGKALDTARLFNLNGYTVTVRLANGDYGPVACPKINGSGAIEVIGNEASPSSVRITALSGSAVRLADGYTFAGVKVSSASPNSATGDGGAGYLMTGGGQAIIRNFDLGQCQGAHIAASGPCSVFMAGSMAISGGLTANIFAPGISFWPTAGAYILTDYVNPPPLTIPVAINIPCFVGSDLSGNAVIVFASIAGKGNVTGKRFAVSTNGVVSSKGSGDTYYPGTIAGTTSQGGQYT